MLKKEFEHMKIMEKEINKKVLQLFTDYKNEINNPDTYEFYLFNKYDEMVDLLSKDERITFDILSSCSDDMLISLLFDSNDSVDKILQNTKSNRLAQFFLETLNSKKFHKTQDEIQTIKNICDKYYDI